MKVNLEPVHHKKIERVNYESCRRCGSVDQYQREISQIWPPINDSGSHQWFRVPSIFLECRVPGVVPPYLGRKHHTGMKPQYHLDISHACHPQLWLGHNFRLLAVCARIWNLYGQRTNRVRARHSRETIGKRLLGPEPSSTRRSLISILFKRIVFKFEMVKNVTLVE